MGLEPATSESLVTNLTTTSPSHCLQYNCFYCIGFVLVLILYCIVAAKVAVDASPSQTFKSPPHRRNVFAQSKDSSAARQRFDINATKDKLASPEPAVEVRSRSVTVGTILHKVISCLHRAANYPHIWEMLY